MPQKLYIGCKNRPPYADEYVMKPGLDINLQSSGRIIKNTMSKSCKVDVKMTDPGCQGCWWQTNLDPRDPKPQDS